MSQEFSVSPDEFKSYSWSQVWLHALTRPSVETFERLINDPKASSNRGYGWVFICSTIGYVIVFLIPWVFGNPIESSPISGLNGPPLHTVSTIWLVCCAPIVGALAVLVIAVQAGLTQLITRMLGGTGSYSRLAYAFATYTAPLTIVTTVTYAIPYLNLCLAPLLAIYTLVLMVIAINAVNQFGWGKSIASAIIIPVVIIILVACITIVFLTLLAPAIGDVFSEIIRALETPASTSV